MTTSGFSAIASVIKDAYGVNAFAVTALVLVFTMAYVPINLPASKIIETYGIAVPIRISCMSIFIGSWFRLLSVYSFYYILAGQVILAIGYPFVQSIGPKIAAVWCGDNERAFATTFTSVSHIFGILIGFAIPIFFVSEDDLEDPNEAISKIQFYILVQSAVVTVLAVPIFILVKAKPMTPPSKSAKLSESTKTNDIMKSVKIFLCHKNAWILTLCYTLMLTVYGGKYSQFKSHSFGSISRACLRVLWL